MLNSGRCIIIAALLVQAQIVYLYLSSQQTSQPVHSIQTRVIIDHPEENVAPTSEKPVIKSSGIVSYSEAARQIRQHMDDSTYRYHRKLHLPLMNLEEKQLDHVYRIALGRSWLRSKTLVIAATVRNAMNGLESSISIMKQLSTLFRAVTVVIVENDSTDNTRQYLHALTKNNTDNFTVYLLGCGNVNSVEPCHLNISYRSSGRQHLSGHKEQAGRNLAEESTDRGLVMAALRNMYLGFIYTKCSNADLLLVLEADVLWHSWSMDAVAQGLYYFRAKPRLDSLCAFTTYGDSIQDPCTLIFYQDRHFYADAAESSGPFIDRIGSPNTAYKQRLFGLQKGRGSPLPVGPVKVASCFQAAAFYRMSSLRGAQAFYRYSKGEWQCEHSTLSMQLRENYLDTEMRFSLANHKAG